MNLLDHLDGVVGGALLIANLDQLAVLLLRGHQQLALAGVLAGGFFDIHVLAGLEAEHGHGRMPVVGRGHGDSVDLFGFEDAAEIAFALGRIAKHLLRFGGKFGQDVGVHVTDVGNAGGLAVGLERRKVRACAAFDAIAVNGEVQTVVGAETLRVTLGGGGKCRARHTRGQVVHKASARNHRNLQFCI